MSLAPEDAEKISRIWKEKGKDAAAFEFAIVVADRNLTVSEQVMLRALIKEPENENLTQAAL